MAWHIPFLGATWTMTGIMILAGIAVLAMVGAFYIPYLVDCQKMQPSCNCDAGTISKECVCVCYKPHKVCTCQEQIDDINKRGLYIDQFVAARRDELLNGQRPNWNPDLSQGEGSGGTSSQGSPDGGVSTGESKKVTVGSVSSKNIPIVLPEYAATYCEDVVKGLCVHEISHITSSDTGGSCKDPWNWWTLMLSNTFNKKIKNDYQDGSEFKAYSDETDYLRARIMAIQATCGSWKCRRTGVITNSSGECASTCPPASLGYPAPTCVKLDAKTGKWNPSLLTFNFI